MREAMGGHLDGLDRAPPVRQVVHHLTIPAPPSPALSACACRVRAVGPPAPLTWSRSSGSTDPAPGCGKGCVSAAQGSAPRQAHERQGDGTMQVRLLGGAGS